MKISIDVSGEQQLTTAFRKVEASTADFRPYWKEVQKKFFEIESDLFQSAGAKGAGGKWKPLSSAYEKVKVAKYGTFALLAGVMIATEALYKSLTRHTNDSIADFQPLEASFGTSLKYAKPHYEGRGRLPVRKVIDPTEKDSRALLSVLRKQIVTEVKKSGLTVNENSYTDI